jgi:hypothetical protein
MKKLLFLIVFMAVFSCEKQKEQCWICIDQYNSSLPPLETKVICDPVAASEQNSKKHYYDQGRWHDWTCTPQ